MSMHESDMDFINDEEQLQGTPPNKHELYEKRYREGWDLRGISPDYWEWVVQKEKANNPQQPEPKGTPSTPPPGDDDGEILSTPDFSIPQNQEMQSTFANYPQPPPTLHSHQLVGPVNGNTAKASTGR